MLNWSSFQEQAENWDDDENDTASTTTRTTNFYFKAVPYADNDNQRSTYHLLFTVDL
jgi:hypothetical protein